MEKGRAGVKCKRTDAAQYEEQRPCFILVPAQVSIALPHVAEWLEVLLTTLRPELESQVRRETKSKYDAT